jgi:catechol 2,3-dioxygenase-like lactoylglutathione lyase family enzyme
MKYICPLLVVSDMLRSRKFYEGLLGQKVKADFGENVTYEGDFAIHLESHYSGLIDGKAITKGGNNFEIYFEEDDLESVLKKLSAEDVEFVHPLREQPWRQKVLRFYDPDGHIIEIGETFAHLCYRLKEEGKSMEEIMKITYMPEAFVNQAVEKFAR